MPFAFADGMGFRAGLIGVSGVEARMYCGSCGTAIPAGGRFCNGCGRPTTRKGVTAGQFVAMAVGVLLLVCVAISGIQSSITPTETNSGNSSAREAYLSAAREQIQEHIRHAEACQLRQDRACVSDRAYKLWRLYQDVSEIDHIDRSVVVQKWRESASSGDLGYAPIPH